jgi:short-subunit dehydrogenase
MTSPISSALEAPRGALIVGASVGLGAAIAHRLAREGYHLALVSRNTAALATLCEQINTAAGRPLARAYTHDVTHTAEVPALFETILRDLGQLDLVLYNAGLLLPVGLSEFDTEKDQAMFAVNIGGALAWLNPAAQLFERQGRGQIAGISSIAGDRGRIGAPAYNASKAALNSYLESLRNRLTRKGVHVMTMRPGFLRTEMLKHSPRTMFVISPEQAADDIWNALKARKQVVYSPARWRLIGLVIRHIPSFIFRRLSF